MGKIDWVVRSFGISLVNDLTTWIIALIIVVVIINMILEVFNDNNK